MKKIEYILSIPKSFYFCLRVLPLAQAIRLPILIRYSVLVRKFGTIILAGGGGKFANVKIGFGHVGIFDKTLERTIWDVSGNVVFYGRACIGHGSRIVVAHNGNLTFGTNFASTADMSLVCYKKITFGANVLISWNTLLMDTDFHPVSKDNNFENRECDKDISIGDHVWIGCRSTILKGVTIGNDNIIAAGCLVTKSFLQTHLLIAGNPGVIKKTGVYWKNEK